MTNTNTVQWLPFHSFDNFNLHNDVLYVFQFAAVSIPLSLLNAPKQWLTIEEQQILAKRRAQQRLNFLASRYFIKQLLAQHLGCKLLDLYISFDQVSQQLQVYYQTKLLPYTLTISHKDDQLLIALSLKSLVLGVDLEALAKKRDFINIAASAFHPSEITALAKARLLSASFYQLWTLKECLVKAKSQSLMKVLALDIKSELADQALSFCTFVENNYMGAVVYPQHFDFKSIRWFKC